MRPSHPPSPQGTMQPPPPRLVSSQPNSRDKPRRRPDLSLPLPQRDPRQLVVPLPLPPSSNQAQSISFAALDKICRIGSGSGGTVYKVVHRPTARVYALKVIYDNHEDSVRSQICREIQP